LDVGRTKLQSLWAIQVHEILENFISMSNIRAEVAADNGKTICETGGFIGKSNVRRMLAYFSLVGLCRFHSIMGQPEEALRALSPLNPYNRQNLYTFKIAMANINLYYYAGVSYLMLKRYIDAGRCFNTILSYIIRIKPQYRYVSPVDACLHTCNMSPVELSSAGRVYTSATYASK
jgi:translation initiation factor 3 subunit L